jgi:hypothetical protein
VGIRRARVVSVLAVVIVCSAPRAFAQMSVCDWKPTKTQPPLGSQNGIVEWGSTADDDGGLWNIATFVGNLDKAGPRNISWAVAGMRVENLMPQQFAIACHKALQGRSDLNGSLFFGRDRASIETHIYSSGGPPPKDVVAGKPLMLTSQAIVSGKDGKNGAIQVKVTTTVEKTAKGYRVTYEIENISNKDVVVDFPVDREVVTKLADGGVLTLKPKTKKTATIDTSTFPSIVRLPLQVAEAPKTGVLAIVNVPTARAAR